MISSGPLKRVPAIIASAPEMRNAKGNVTPSSRRTATICRSGPERAITNRTLLEARSRSAGTTAMVPATDSAPVGTGPAGPAPSSGG